MDDSKVKCSNPKCTAVLTGKTNFCGQCGLKQDPDLWKTIELESDVCAKCGKALSECKKSCTDRGKISPHYEDNTSKTSGCHLNTKDQPIDIEGNDATNSAQSFVEENLVSRELGQSNQSEKDIINYDSKIRTEDGTDRDENKVVSDRDNIPSQDVNKLQIVDFTEENQMEFKVYTVTEKFKKQKIQMTPEKENVNINLDHGKHSTGHVLAEQEVQDVSFTNETDPKEHRHYIQQSKEEEEANCLHAIDNSRAANIEQTSVDQKSNSGTLGEELEQDTYNANPINAKRSSDSDDNVNSVAPTPIKKSKLGEELALKMEESPEHTDASTEDVNANPLFDIALDNSLSSQEQSGDLNKQFLSIFGSDIDQIDRQEVYNRVSDVKVFGEASHTLQTSEANSQTSINQNNGSNNGQQAQGKSYAEAVFQCSNSETEEGIDSSRVMTRSMASQLQHEGNMNTNDGVLYRKPANPPDYQEPVTNSQKSDKDSNNKEKQSPYGQATINVNFYVVVPPEFKFNPKRDEIHLRSTSPHFCLSGDKNKHVLQVQRKLKEDYILLEYKVSLPKNAFANGKKVEYKYRCEYGDTKEGTYEFVYRAVNKGQIADRLLHIPDKLLNTIDQWNQYDGLMLTQIKDQNVLIKFFTGDNYKVVMEKAKLAAKAMLPRWAGFCLHSDSDDTSAAEHVLAEIQQVGHCSKAYFLQSRGKIHDDTKFKEVLHEYITPRLEKWKTQMNQTNFTETTDEACLRLATAVSIVSIYVKYQLNFKHFDITKPLLYALTIRPSTDGRCWDYENLISFHFPNKIEDIVESLTNFLRGMVHVPYGTVKFCETNWLRAVPLFHFLSNQSQPCVPVSPSALHANDTWWGLIGIEQLVTTFKQIMKNEEMPLKLYFEVLGPLFKIDHLLQRTLLAVMGWMHLAENLDHKLIDGVVFAANITFFLKSFSFDGSNLKILGNHLNVLKAKLDDEVENVSKLHEVMGLQHQADECEMECEITLDLIDNVMHRCIYTDNHLTLQAATKVMITSINKYQAVVENATVKKLHPFNHAKCVENIERNIKSLGGKLQVWIQTKLPCIMIAYSSGGMYNQNELKIFTWLFGIDTGNPDLNNWWKDKFENILKQRLDKEPNSRRKVELFCKVDFSKYHKVIEEVFSKTAFTLIESGIENGCDFIFELATDGGYKFKKLLSCVLESAWPKVTGMDDNEDQILILTHTLSWPSFTRFVNMISCRGEKSKDLLTVTSQQLIMIGLSLIDHLWQKFKDGTIQIQFLKIILQNPQAFGEICDMQDKHLQGTKNDQFKNVLPFRQAEINAFESLHQRLGGFLAVCKTIPAVEWKVLSEKVSLNVDEAQLCHLCQLQKNYNELPEPQVTFFGISNALSEILEDFNQLRNSIIFLNKWKVNGNRLVRTKLSDGEKTTISLDELVKNIWSQTYDQIFLIVEKLTTGLITFAEVDEIFEEFQHNYIEMNMEVQAMCKGLGMEYCNQLQDRIKQVEQYEQLNIYRKGAMIMKQIKDGFNLTGDFAVLDVLITVGNDKTQSLVELTEDVVSIGLALQGVTEKQANCIKVFHKAIPLVTWLRENVKDTKEIQTLVDLAMMSAQGQGGDMEVARVTCLHAAAVGYAPLIYELKQNADFTTFLSHCEQVWKSLETDKNLPKKLEDTARHLDWLKHVKDSHGSVELDALSQAENINSRGIYRIGCQDEQSTNTAKSLSEVLALKVPPEKLDDDTEESEWNTYNHETLKDLQSKLMLVAGKAVKGKKQVDRFMEIFDGVTRLATTYTKLCKAGSILFRNWNVMFYCEPNRNVHTEIDFGLAENTMQGSTETCTDVTQHINELCEFMDECLEQWQHNTEVKRGEFYFLNFFTTEQLVILRKEVAKLCAEDESTDVPNVVYSMLSCIKPGCSEENLLEAVHTAEEDFCPGGENTVEIDMESDASCVDLEYENIALRIDDSNFPYDSTHVIEYIDELQCEGFSEELALKSLQEVGGPDNIEEGKMWCMLHMNDNKEDQEINALSGEQTTSLESMDTVKIQSSMKVQFTLEDLKKELLDKRQRQSNLKQQLEELWLEYLKTATVTSVSDFLSIQHLGYILEQLASQVNRELKRPMPTSLKIASPNLIICPQGEMLQTVLSIYMFEGGHNLELPSVDEVLLCTENTRLEEVELLWRRAFGMHKQEKIFCLLNADRLDYEVSKKAEEKFEKLSKGIHDYRLVIICSSEREDKSNIVSAFERHKVKSPYVCSVKDIQQYLHHHYQMTHDDMNPAGKIDPERCNVRVIKSNRAGVGKTLKAKRFAQEMKRLNGECEEAYISLHRRNVDVSEILNVLLQYTQHPSRKKQMLFHIDIAHEAINGVDDLLFSLLVLGSLTDEQGYVWLRSDLDLYLIEVMPLVQKDVKQGVGVHGFRSDRGVKYVHQMLHYLPALLCWSPSQSLNIMGQNPPNKDYPEYQAYDQLMDEEEFQSNVWQRVFQYLNCHANNQNLDTVNPEVVTGTPTECIDVLLRYCGINDPSWAELRHFVWFLNIQLEDCENSSFTSFHAAEDLPGFKTFVVKSMIQMSRDFATRSLIISEQTPGIQARNELIDDGALEMFQMKRHWETSPHPYVFFNSDHHSMTFLGFNIDGTGNMVDQRNNQVLERNVMPRPLKDALIRNRVPLNENFDMLQRHEKITKLCQVMGNEFPHDPDPTYVLTADNTKKIVAIYMRFRCGIPVIIMGETGCGKTRLVEFMCDIQKPAGAQLQNRILMKVHGGTTEKDIKKTLGKALTLAEQNRKQFTYVDTVLFFDEANTTEEIGLIKQVMCDQKVLGAYQHGLRIVAACNPYRKHSEKMITKLEQAGLGYHIRADQTTDKLGHIPMRRLVYRVQALPQSMLPLVWDFGQLNTDTEQSYIEEMVNKCIRDGLLPNKVNLQRSISRVLTASQEFMRKQEDECSFVSLRDVQRTLSVMTWFYHHRNNLFTLMEKRAMDDIGKIGGDIEDYEVVEPVTRSLILALGVCYHACLEKREEYREHVAQYFEDPLKLPNDDETIREEIDRVQNVFLDEIKLEDNIARNQALKENVFMMVVCIELRIPLFLVGKPGSSKSLAKTIVADAMQGDAAKSPLFKNFKMVHMVSYQCSPISTPDGIVSTFHQCAQLQIDRFKDFVSIVVLDEIGLAEDSPRMPLKALHPLLEDGCQGEEEAEQHKKVAFIGISNWALDPAKMNRGILVQRGVPNEQELEHSAEGICAKNPLVKNLILEHMRPMAQAYLELYDSALQVREFFGLRDFYSIIKMVYNFSKRSKQAPTWYEIKHAILRNFGGLDNIKPLEVFEKKLIGIKKDTPHKETDPDCSTQGLIKACLFGEGLEGINSESRYLLILTENYAALKIIQQQLHQLKDAIYIFGSSFPKDQEYTQICRNINRIKICMETGQKVVLLNLNNLYESLYDALNQYYVYLGEQRFVDLGLGSHRVKCKVHENFRLIVVEEKDVVYRDFAIPLINRLEKHILTMETVLTDSQQQLAKELDSWAKAFATVDMTFGKKEHKLTVGDVFIGYDKDTAASVILCVSQMQGKEYSQIEMLDESKHILLQCATPESIVNLEKSQIRNEAKRWTEVYLKDQQHESLQQFLLANINNEHHPDRTLFVQLTTHSKLLSRTDIQQIHQSLGMQEADIRMESLQEFDTEQQFCKQLGDYFSQADGSDKLLIIQCDSGDENAKLIASAQYSIISEYRQQTQILLSQMDDAIHGINESHTNIGKKHVVFVIQLPRRRGGCFIGFQGGEWISYHIDELRPQGKALPSFQQMNENCLSTLFENSLSILNKTRNQQPEINVPAHSSTNTESYQYADMPLLEGYTEDDYVELGYRPPPKEDNTSSRITSMELDSEDHKTNTPAEFENTSDAMDVEDHSSDLRKSDTKLDIDAIIKDCIHGAAAMLKDESDTMRKTYRVLLLLKLMDNDTPASESMLTFMNVVKKRILLLLKNKEETTTGFIRAKQWLSNEAASYESVTKAGTFVRSIWKNIEEKVTQMLAKVVAHCDPNCNLNLLCCEETEEWIQQIWLQIFNDEEIIRLSHGGLDTGIKWHKVERVLVSRHGFQGSDFQCKFPFSWIIKEQVDLLLHNTRKGYNHAVDDQAVDSFAIVTKLFNKSPMGKIIEKVGTDEYNQFIKKYISDFVKMVYKCQSTYPEKEEQLIEQAIEIAANNQSALNFQHIEERVNGDNTMECDVSGHVLTIPLVHMAYDSLKSRLQMFAQVVAIWPESIKQLSDFRDRQPNHQLVSAEEHRLEFGMLYCILEHLEPEKDEINMTDSRQQWLEKVERMKPVTESMFEIVTNNIPGQLSLGEKSSQTITKCRSMWSRVCAVQLFIKNVCLTVEKEDKNFKRCMPLWMALGDNTDFKKEESLKRVELFLIMCNKEAVKQHFGETKDCSVCRKIITDPVKMPCKGSHVVCLVCIQIHIHWDQLHCPVCKEKLPKKYSPQVTSQNSEAKDAYNQYKQRCNSFFMDLVSQLCFAGDIPPDDNVVQKLLSYVTKEPELELGEKGRIFTRKLSVLQDTIDPTPVVRSFLLQLLLRSHVSVVMEHISMYFAESRKILHKRSDHMTELCLLFVYCLEDACHNQYQQCSDHDKAFKIVEELLHSANSDILRTGLNIKKLKAIAEARFALQITAEWMYRVHDVNETKYLMQVKKIEKAARELCDHKELQWPKLYLLRQLCQRYGTDTLLKVTTIRQLQWLVPDEIDLKQEHVSKQPDRFITCGDDYKAMRESLIQALLMKDFKKLSKDLKKGKANTKRLLSLALFSEVTMNSQYQEEQIQITDDAKEALTEFISGSEILDNVDLAKKLINNNLADNCHHLKINANVTIKESMLVEVAIHMLLTLSQNHSSKWMQPFINLMSNAADMANLLLPTMPFADIESIREAMSEARNRNQRQVQGVDPNVVFYMCPNSHVYVIGDCGRPYETRNCPVCGLKIGGENHKLTTGNTKMTEFLNQKSNGHILGKANERSDVPVPERDISPASVAILRLFTHIAMYLAANEDVDSVCRLITPTIQNDQVPHFLWEHMLVDLRVLSKAINRSFDHTILFVHLVINNFTKIKPSDKGLDSLLQTNKSRRDWEKRFCDMYVSPLLAELDDRIRTANDVLLKDDRLGRNPLLRMVFQADQIETTQNINQMENAALLWTFRTRVTIENLTQVLNETHSKPTTEDKNQSKGDYAVLRLFLKREPLLRAVYYLPMITKLQRLLLQKYYGAIDKADATILTVREFLSKLPPGPIQEEYKQLINAFGKAWILIKEHLDTFGFVGMMIPKQYSCEQITDETPLAMLLPSWKGHGLCSMATVYFLAQIQNDFLEDYGSVTKQTFSTHTSSNEATAAHLVSYHPDRDLLPMVLANSNYSLSVGQSTSHQYDFEGLQKQIEERLINGKTLIRPQVEHIVYRADFTNAGVFNSLRKRISQEPLGTMLQQQIIVECRSKSGNELTEINSSMAVLDIAIGFLLSWSGNNDSTKLKQFLTEELQMKKLIHSQKAMQQCSLIHVQALWLLLSQERAKIQAKCGQDAFDNVADKYQEVLTNDQVARLHTVFQHMNVDTFMTELYECIMLQISVPQDENDPNYIDDRHYSLGDVLQTYLEYQESQEIMDDGFSEGTLPPDFQLQHCVSIWLEAHNFLKLTTGKY